MPRANMGLQTAVTALSNEWPEYAMEAANLALFMVSACVFGTLLAHPESRLHQWIGEPGARRAAMGLVMGLTALAIVHSPFGQRSGAHMNPAVTLTYWTLGRVRAWTAVFYIAAQFVGGVIGVQAAWYLIGPPLGHAAVNYVATHPGEGGPNLAFAAEFAISLLLMLVVLIFSNARVLSRWTPVAASCLVALYIFVEAPYSGMSMNPARTTASAVAASDWHWVWIYFLAPPLGMLTAGLLYGLRRGNRGVYCAKLYHHNPQRCIFRCGFGDMA